MRADLAADHQLLHRLQIHFILVQGSDKMAVPHDCHAVANRHQFLHVMGDKHNASASVPNLAHILVENMPPVGRQSIGGFVNDQQHRLRIHGSCDLDELPILQIQRASNGSRIDMLTADLIENPASLLIHPSEVQHPMLGKLLFLVQKDIGTYRNSGNRSDLLHNQRDAVLGGILRICRRILFSLQEKCSGIRPMKTNHNGRECTFSGTVLAD